MVVAIKISVESSLRKAANQIEPVLISFPQRHSLLPNSLFNASFKQPTGLHPTQRLQISDYSGNHCPLYALYYIPKGLFIDPYQLQDYAEFGVGNIKDMVLLIGEKDLEDPIWRVGGWGSILLVELSNSRGVQDVELPLHLRYAEPLPLKGFTTVSLPWPSVFRACQANHGIQSVSAALIVRH